jgi:RHH-type rel operon transcriptional repressor/antitoxin RelB
MLTLRLPPVLDKELSKQARAAKQTKSELVRSALAERLAEAEDLRVATKRLRALRAGKSRTYSAEEVKRDLGISV